MKYLKTYEYVEHSYEFNPKDFITKFKFVYNDEYKINKCCKGEFFDELNNIIDNFYYSKDPINKTATDVVEYILQNKEIEIYDREIGEYSGKVKKSDFSIFIFNIPKNNFRLGVKIDFYDNTSNFHDDDTFTHNDFDGLIKIYGEKTKIEKLVEFYSSIKKFNL